MPCTVLKDQHWKKFKAIQVIHALLIHTECAAHKKAFIAKAFLLLISDGEITEYFQANQTKSLAHLPALSFAQRRQMQWHHLH